MNKKTRKDLMKENLRKQSVLIIKKPFLTVLTLSNKNTFNSKQESISRTLTLMKILENKLNSRENRLVVNYRCRNSLLIRRTHQTRKTRERRRRDRRLNNKSKSRKCSSKMAFKWMIPRKLIFIPC